MCVWVCGLVGLSAFFSVCVSFSRVTVCVFVRVFDVCISSFPLFPQEFAEDSGELYADELAAAAAAAEVVDMERRRAVPGLALMAEDLDEL